MSASEKDGGQAFPDEMETGMTLRDYFAAAAMQGYIAAGAPTDATYRDIADKAYRAADAMLERRDKSFEAPR